MGTVFRFLVFLNRGLHVVSLYFRAGQSECFGLKTTPIATDRWETLEYLVVLNQRAFLSEFVGLKVFERERVHSCLSGGWEVG